jgi:hypothetical protein
MSRYKPIRSKRYETLRAAGFLAAEAHVLSKVPSKVPYLRMMMQDRKVILNRAIKKEYTQAKYKEAITKLYKVKGWSHNATIASKKQYQMNASAYYKMLREYEERYKDEKGSQAFKSPWVKKQKTFQDFSRKFDNLYNKKQFID